MNISIDIDGVLVDREKYQIEKAIEFAHKENLSDRIIDPYAYNVDEIFGWERKSFNDFWSEYLWDYSKLPPINGAKEILKKLQNDGHEIIINTSRWLSEKNNSDGEKMRKAVVDWFNQNELFYDELIFACGDKNSVIKKYNIDCHIEDNPVEAEPIAEKIPVVMFRAKYNENFNGKNIYHAKDWNEVYQILKCEIEQKN